ncbi:MAG: hypothetical protein O3A29_20785 [Planctomycetota bacterium]|nr:hypothetical protein [Planctomycetota bacterium]
MRMQRQHDQRSAASPSTLSGHNGFRRNVPSRNASRNSARPVAAYRRRGQSDTSSPFCAPETWHEPTDSGQLSFIVHEPGDGYWHPVTVEEIQQRIDLLPSRFIDDLEVVQLSHMTKKRSFFPFYGMQWGVSVFLYPIEESLTECYNRPPTPAQLIEARMYGGKWEQQGRRWTLRWTESTIKDFYLNNVLIHEIGHLNDYRNTKVEAREQYANWFAIEHGYRASRGRK